MEFFRNLLKTRDKKYENELDKSNEALKNRLLNHPKDFKLRFQGRIWLICECDAERCAGFSKDKITANRLLRIIEFYKISKSIDQDLLTKIEAGSQLEPNFLIYDTDSYEWSATRLTANQDTFQIIRRLKFRC